MGIFYTVPCLVTEDFINEYNEERPHELLGNLTPVGFAAQRAGGTPGPLRNPGNSRKCLLLGGPNRGDFTN